MKNSYPELKKGRDNSSGVLDKIEKHIMLPSFPNDKNFFQLFAENARDLIFHLKFKPSYKFDYVSPSSTHITGYTPEEFYADPLLAEKCIPPEDLRRVTDPSLWKNPADIKPVEVRWKRKDGKIIWTEHMISPILGKDGKPESLNIIARDITERKRIEEALRESEEKFSKAFRSSPQIMAITTFKEGRFVDVNDSYTHFTGYTREEVLGRKSAELNVWISDADRERMLKLLRETGRVRNEEFKFRAKSGEIRTWLFSAEPITIGGEEHLIGVSTDITERKKMEEKLQESEEKFSKAFYSSPDMMAIASLKDGKYTEVNDSYTNCLGYTRKELIGHTAEELNLWVKPEETENIIAAMNKHGKMREAGHSVRTKSGQLRNWVCSGDVITINSEPYMIAVAKDITEQKAVEEKLQEHKKMIESILSTMPEGVLVIDGKQNILLANKAMHKIFELDSRSLKKKELADIFPKKRFFNLHKAVKGRKKEKKNLEFRYRIDGLEKIIDCVIVKMDGGRTLLCFSDISREREEEEKLYLTDRLASIGEMAAGLAHELNNPLTGILALSQMLAHANLSGEYKEDLECINNEAKRAASIVKNVLLFARSKTGEISQSSVNDVIRNVLKLREYEEKAGNITIVTNLEEYLPSVPVDKWQLQQVFLNLISNAEAAIKEVDRPGIITISTQKTNSHVNIVLSDNGCGIKKQIIPRIFDPFFTTKEIGRGTGLGLSICYSIIVKHGGKINVKSQVNEGTTFNIRMPVVR